MRLSLRFVVIGGVVAYALGVAMRLLWLGLKQDLDADQNPFLGTYDAFYYASAVQHALYATQEFNLRIPLAFDNALVSLGTLTAKLLGVPIGTVARYLPVAISPLIVCPVLLIGQLTRRPFVGIGAALLASGGFSYFSRTHPGYFDTDMFSVTLALGVAAVFMVGLARPQIIWRVAAGLLIISAPFFHPGSAAVMAMLSIALVAYLLIFDRENDSGVKLLIVAFIAMLPAPWALRLVFIGAAEAVWHKHSLSASAHLVVVLLLGSAVVVFGAYFQRLFVVLPGFTQPHAIESAVGFVGIHGSVNETANVTFGDVARRTAGSPVLFGVALVGYFALLVRHPSLLVTLPLFVLGVIVPMSKGLRFSMYSVPLAALGTSYAAGWLPTWVHQQTGILKRLWQRKVLTVLLMLVPLMTACLYVHRLPVPTVIRNSQAHGMSALARIGKPGDYVISWWDYAYSLWFYGHINTLIDGSKHNADTFVVSEILYTSSQRVAANLSVLATHRYQKEKQPLEPAIRGLLQDWQDAGNSPDSFLPRLAATSYVPPKAEHETYLYLPWQLLPYTSIVSGFRRARGLDPRSDRPANKVLVAMGVERLKKRHKIGDYTYDATKAVVIAKNGRSRKIRSQSVVRYGEEKNPIHQRVQTNQDGDLNLIFIPKRKLLLIVDQEIYDSVYVQLMIFENYDPNLFKLVVRHPTASIYQVVR